MFHVHICCGPVGACGAAQQEDLLLLRYPEYEDEIVSDFVRRNP